uniref:Protein kinase domain-containing protein n=1 Tax=Quercus lobata TaxID=97700 RepID=A0A7N2LQN8_QUELO
MGSCIDFTIEDIQSFVTEFTEANVIGSRAFGLVYRGLISSDNKHGIDPQAVAVKKSFGLTKEHHIQFEAEISFGSILNHPNIVNLIGYCDGPENLYLIYEFVPNGSVANHLQELTWDKCLKVIKGVVSAIDYMHGFSDSIVHGDVKPHNMLLTMDFDVKLADFGHAKREGQRVISGAVGSGYIPTRAVRAEKRNDLYGVGTVILQLLWKKNHRLKDSFHQWEHIRNYAVKNQRKGAHLKLRLSGCSAATGKKLNTLALTCVPDSMEEDEHHYPTIAEISAELRHIGVNKIISKLYNSKLKKVFVTLENLFG